jgi:hypothetical protein
MKAKNLLIVVFIALFFSRCVVYSFYPLYTEKDLFPNDLLTGEWLDEDGAQFIFKHQFKGKKELGIIDSTSYTMELIGDEKQSEFNVHVIKLGGHYFLDFYLEDYVDNQRVELADFHIIPVHTFAKVIIDDNQLQINWFDQDWMGELIKQNKIRIHHEENEDFILLTAQPKELQKFVTKYVNSEEAFEDGLELVLKRK